METKPTIQEYLYNETPISFQIENGDTMINATTMAKSFEKQPASWLRTQNAKEYIEVLSAMRNCIPSDLMIVTNGDNGGTWMHEDLALEFARWLNPKFGIWCNDRIKELFRFGITASSDIIEKIKTDPEYVKEVLCQVEEHRNKSLELAEHNKKLQAQIAESAPKVIFFDNVTKLNESDQKRKTFTISQIAKPMKLSAASLNRTLIRHGVITKINGNMYINDKYKDCEYAFERITQTRKFDEETEKFDMADVTYLVWSLAGRDFIVDFLSKFKEKPKSKSPKEIKYLPTPDFNPFD